ncbi:sulfurtransferase TusA family protein [Pseudothermotoga thermarum]
MLLRDNCLTVFEVASKLKIDFSTAYRYLNQMVKAGILTVVKSPEGDRYDFSSVHIFRILEEIAEFVLEKAGKKSSNFKTFQVFSSHQIPTEKFLDLCGQLCPVPEIMTKRELEKLRPGETLVVACDYPLSKERIISFSVRNGYEVSVDQIGPVAKIYIRKP